MIPSRPLGFRGAIVPWGAHLLGLYNDPTALDEPIMRYFEAGLAAGEACLWITGAGDATARLRRAVAQFGHLANGFANTPALRAVSFRDWYYPTGRLDAELVLEKWTREMSATFHSNFAGLRLFAEVEWDSHEELEEFVHYENRVGETLKTLRMVAVCGYFRPKVPDSLLDQLRRAHDSTLDVPQTRMSLFVND